jgi:hypothetical protein
MKETLLGPAWTRTIAMASVLAFGLAACSGSNDTQASSHVHGTGGAGGSGADAGSADAARDPASLAAQAFVWGYPLVVSQRTLQTLGALVGVDALFNQAALSTAQIRIIVSPNQDTLYSISVLDLRSEPVVLTVPDVTDRYWTYQFLDAWTDSFHYLGTRATLGKGGSFVITPPGWAGTVPAGTEQIASPTPELFLLGRYLVKSDADVANVVALQRSLVPLHTLTGDAAPAPPPPLGKAPGTPQEVGSTGAAFFDELGDTLAQNPPATDADKAHLASFTSLGIGPGLHPAATAMAAGAASLAVLEAGVSRGAAQIDAAATSDTKAVNGWVAHLDIGTYADNLLLRAAVAKLAWGANVPAEAVYPVSNVDAAGQPYTGAKPYVLHFDAGGLPPVDAKLGFWSLTLYGPDRFFVANAMNRYAIGDRTPGLVFNADGSLDLYIQSDTPQGHEANWLPAPPGAFSLMLRLYLPQQSVMDGTYVYPPVIAGG